MRNDNYMPRTLFPRELSRPRRKRHAPRSTPAGRLERVKQIVLREHRRGPFFEETQTLVAKLLEALTS